MSITLNSGIEPPSIDGIAALIKNPFSASVPLNGERPQDFPGGFQITEYVNGSPVTTTQIRLTGNLMPQQPFPWEREQRLTKQFYPGNPEAAVHVLGSKQSDLVIHGKFKDKHYKDASYYGVAYQYSQALEQMCERGNIVKFGMSGPAGSWFRWGYILKANFKMYKQSSVEYEISFSIVSDRQPVNNYFTSREKQSPDSINQNLLNKASDFQAAYSAAPASMPKSLADLLNGAISDIAHDLNLVTNFVSTVVATAADIGAASQRALGLIKNARAGMSAMNRKIDSVAHSFTNYSSSGSAATKTSDTYKNLGYITSITSSSFELSAFLRQMQTQFEALARTVPKARYKVQVNDTLHNVSMKFYGTADNWETIQKHNKLTSTTLSPGKVLEIPNV